MYISLWCPTTPTPRLARPTPYGPPSARPTLQQHALQVPRSPWVPQRRKAGGLNRSIVDKTLHHLAHSEAAAALRVDDAGTTSFMSRYTAAAVSASAALSTLQLHSLRSSRIAYWEEAARSLPHDEAHPFHVRLLEWMNAELDLVERGSARLSRPLEVVVTVVQEGARVAGGAAYDKAFERQNLPPSEMVAGPSNVNGCHKLLLGPPLYPPPTSTRTRTPTPLAAGDPKPRPQLCLLRTQPDMQTPQCRCTHQLFLPLCVGPCASVPAVTPVAPPEAPLRGAADASPSEGQRGPP